MKIVIPAYVSTVLNRLTLNGYQAYIVGGCVRDSLLHKSPDDYDVCTDCVPEEMVKIFGDMHTIETGLKHGTLTVMSHHMPVEVTTFRSDGDYKDHRRPENVRFEKELSQDLKRRDFTINAMCYNEQEGIIDLFGGVSDLEKGIIKCVGDPEQRFEEDALRIMRAVRFASTLDFQIEKDTLSAMHKKCESLDLISAERIFTELKKLLCGRGVERVLQEHSSIITQVIPELAPCIGCKQDCPHHCYDVYTHICKSVANILPDEELRLTMLFHDIEKPALKTTDEQGIDHFKMHPFYSAQTAKRILRRLKSSGKTEKRVTDLVREHDNRIPAEKRSVKRLISKYSYEFYSDWLKVRKADTLAQSEYKRAEKLQELRELEQLGELIKAEDSCLKIKDLAVNGNDMIALGLSGSQIRDALEMALEAVIEETIMNKRDELIGYIKGEFPECK